jgi:hypothetical protein
MFLQPEIQELNKAVGWAKSLAIFALAVGLVTMAILQTIKDIFPWRRWFQTDWMRIWMRPGVLELLSLDTNNPSPRIAADSLVAKMFHEEIARRSKEKAFVPSEDSVMHLAMDDLVGLATAGDYEALFNLPIEQLCGQANAALQIAAEHPKKHAVLLWCMGHMNESSFLDSMLNPPEEELKKSMKDADHSIIDAYAAARNRFAHQLQRAVDGFQISTGGRWKLVLQLASIGTSMLLVWLALLLNMGAGYFYHDFFRGLTTSLIVGIAAGFVAPVARDLLAALQSLRK